jgi:hypothetical protein
MKKFSLPVRLTCAIWPSVRLVVVGSRPRTYRSKLVAVPGGRRDVGDLAVGVEAVLREDGNLVGVDGCVGLVKFAGDLPRCCWW